MRRMRWLLCGLALMGMQGAKAADLADSFLRGSAAIIDVPGAQRWDGVYFGGQVGVNVFGSDFTHATSSMTALLLRPGSVFVSATASPLGSVDATGTHFGAFVGYNMQSDGAVLSVEASYNHSNTSVTATNFIAGGWRAPDGSVYSYTATGSSTVRITDYSTLRVRGGWAAGSFMPYATIGVAVGRGEIDRTVVATLTQPGPPPFLPLTVTENSSGQFAYGYAAGLGVDFSVIDNLFVRAEYEYVKFGDFNSVKVHLHNVRLGAAIKF